MEDDCPNVGKSSWPELLGVAGEVAVAVISRENPNLTVGLVKEGMMVTMDVRCDRVRVWVNKHGIVDTVPIIG